MYKRQALYNVLKSDVDGATKLALIKDFDRVLGLSLIENASKLSKGSKEDSSDIPQEVLRLAEERKAARIKKDFALADSIRDKIAELGYTIEETRQGTVIKPSSKG